MKSYTSQRNLKSIPTAKNDIQKNLQRVEQRFLPKKNSEKTKGINQGKDYFVANTSAGQASLELCFQLSYKPMYDPIYPLSQIARLPQTAAKNSSMLSINSITFLLIAILASLTKAQAAQISDNCDFNVSSHELMPSQLNGFAAEVRLSAYKNHIFFNTAPWTTSIVVPEKHPSKPELYIVYKGLPVKNRTSDITSCKKKNAGSSPGKICMIGNVEHFLKAVEEDNSQLLGLYNLAFVKHNLGITVPNACLIYEENGQYYSFASKSQVAASVYLASEKINNFKEINKLEKEYFDTCYRPKLVEKISLALFVREKLINKIGESGLAKIAVAGTFFDDLISNSGNWGYNDQGLVIIDVDHSPGSLAEYLKHAAYVSGDAYFDFSLNTISMMKDLYKEMLTRSPPILHDTTNMSDEFYQLLVQLYVKACDLAILTIETKYPALQANEVSHTINNILSESFFEARDIYLLSGDSPLKYQRYQFDDSDQYFEDNARFSCTS